MGHRNPPAALSLMKCPVVASGPKNVGFNAKAIKAPQLLSPQKCTIYIG